MLNAHPEVAIGMERYKRVVSGGIDQLSADLFTKERFFDFSDGFTNQDPEEAARWGVDYAALAAPGSARAASAILDDRSCRPPWRDVACGLVAPTAQAGELSW